MAKGRKPLYQSDDEKPVMLSLRIPRDVADKLKKYADIHRQSVTEVMLDGIRMRLETPADPRDIILSDDNTVMQEVQEMIRAAVQAEMGKLSDFMGSHVSTPGVMPAPEAPAEPVPEKAQDDHTGVQESARQTAIPDYDETKYVLGKLCPRGHDYHGTGQTLRRRPRNACPACDTELTRERRKAQKQELDEMTSGIRPVPRRSRRKAKHQGQPA